MRPTYRKQFQKIADAYYNYRFDPWDATNDFWGLLFNGDGRCGALLCYGNYEGDLVQAIREDRAEMFQGYVADPLLFSQAYMLMIQYSGGIYTVEDVMAIERVFSATYIKGDQTEEALHMALENALQLLRECHVRFNRKEGRGKVPEIAFEMRRPFEGDEDPLEVLLKGTRVHLLKDEEADNLPPLEGAPEDDEVKITQTQRVPKTGWLQNIIATIQFIWKMKIA